MIGQPLRAAAERFLRPSSIGEIALCPGRALMQAAVVERFGEPDPTAEASVGTVCHTTVAHAIQEWKDGKEWAEAIDYALNLSAVAGMDAWSVRCCFDACEFARDLIAKYEIEPDNVLIEHALPIDGYAQTGTADLVLVVPFKQVIVVDWKFGYLDQGDADEHDQLSSYAYGAAASFKVKECLIFLYQGRAAKDERCTAAVFDAAALKQNEAWTADALAAARGPNPELVPGYRQCVNCRALTRCQAARRMIVQVQEGIELLGYPTDSAEWGRLAGAAKVAERFASDGKDAVKDHLNLGGAVDGWGLASAGSITKIDVPKALELAKAGGFLDALLAHASLKASAAALVPEATSKEPKAFSLKPVKA